MAVEVAVFLRSQGLQQAAVGEVHQVAFGTRAAGDEQCYRLAGMFDDVMAALGDAGGEHLCAVQAVAHRVMLAVGIVAGGEQQGRMAPAAQGPAAQANGTEQQGGESEDLAPEHVSHRRWR
ncbi:hypothetical protein D9M69_313810 [compost metagenome]